MNSTVRRIILSVPGIKLPYREARKLYHRFRIMRLARKYFSNVSAYREALSEQEQGGTITLRSKDGLLFTVRKNCMDAGILGEVFLDREYVRGFRLDPHPVVVDIGGYIGDFAIFAVRYAGASRVVVVEPSPHNWKLLIRNIADNHYGAKITPLEMAVTDGSPVLLDVDAPERAQARVCADYCGRPKAELKKVAGISLAKLVEDFHLDVIDLLKIDCEGGEYLILLTAPAEVLGKIKNLVFEFHEIPGFLARLDAVKKRLTLDGFNIRTSGHLVYASRS
jgi:FkbM family methyltransferase